MDKWLGQEGIAHIAVVVAVAAGAMGILGAGGVYTYLEYKSVSDKIFAAGRLSD